MYNGIWKLLQQLNTGTLARRKVQAKVTQRRHIQQHLSLLHVICCVCQDIFVTFETLKCFPIILLDGVSS